MRRQQRSKRMMLLLGLEPGPVWCLSRVALVQPCGLWCRLIASADFLLVAAAVAESYYDDLAAVYNWLFRLVLSGIELVSESSEKL